MSVPKQVLLHLLVFSTVLSCGSLFWGCSDDSSGVNPADRLCRGQSGFTARITGLPKPLEMCVSDQATIARYFSVGIDEGQWEITAVFTSDSLTIQVDVSFFVQPTFPTVLSLTTNRAQADSDPGAVWFFYRESKLGTYEYVSTSVSGVFSLAFSDSSVAVAALSNLEIQLDDASSGNPAGVRGISEGYVSVTAE